MWFANTHDGVFSNYLKRFYFKDTKGIFLQEVNLQEVNLCLLLSFKCVKMNRPGRGRSRQMNRDGERGDKVF